MHDTRWRPVPCSPDYEVSDHGDVRRRTDAPGLSAHRYPAGFVLSPKIDRDGYARVSLVRADGKRITHRVHRLVLTAFGVRPQSQGRVECNHRNGDKTDNRLSNLEWVTPSENGAHASANGLAARGRRQWQSVLTEAQVRSAVARVQGGETQASVARCYGVHPQTVHAIMTGKSWSWLTDLEAV